MDWNRNEKGDANRAGTVYPSKGRTGRKFAGASRQDQRRAAHQMKMLPSWRRIFKKKFGRWPTDEEIWAAAHQRGGFGQDVDDFVNKIPTTTINHGLTEESKKGLAKMAEWLEDAKKRKEKEEMEEKALEDERRKRVEKTILLMKSPIPCEYLRRVCRGDTTADSLCAVFGVERELVDKLLDAMPV